LEETRGILYLIREHSGSDCHGKIGLDAGANQGVYTYYMATLGFQVLSFEINSENVERLQYASLVNPKEVVDRVHAYPMGLSNNIDRTGSVGSGYGGYLSDVGATGPILSVTLDCFMHHIQSSIDFLKVDVEGYEIAILQGAHSSLREASAKVM
jgi:FkbM family methyltransferase